MAPVGGFCTENYANTWPPNLNRCCWVRVYNPQPPHLPWTFRHSHVDLHDSSPLFPHLSHELRACGATPVTQGTVESGWGEKSTTAPQFSLDWCRTALHECPKLPLTSKWSPCWCLQVDPHWSWLHCSTMFDCLCLQRQGRATINAKTLTLYLLKFTKSSGDGGLYCTRTDRQIHKQTQAHAREGESAFWECLLKPKMKSEVWQSGYQT